MAISSEVIEQIVDLDMTAFLAIHQGLVNPIFDLILPILRNKYTWIPLYLFFVVMAFWKYGVKGLYFVLAAGVTVLLSDQFAAGLMKPAFERLRPCNEPLLAGRIRDLVICGNGFSFISAHATNHFALAMFFSYFFNLIVRGKWIIWAFVFWAAAISFSQIYVGVHYPLDILAGIIFGILIGYAITKLFRLFLEHRLVKN